MFLYFGILQGIEIYIGCVLFKIRKMSYLYENTTNPLYIQKWYILKIHVNSTTLVFNFFYYFLQVPRKGIYIGSSETGHPVEMATARR